MSRPPLPPRPGTLPPSKRAPFVALVVILSLLFASGVAFAYTTFHTSTREQEGAQLTVDLARVLTDYSAASAASVTSLSASASPVTPTQVPFSALPYQVPEGVAAFTVDDSGALTVLAGSGLMCTGPLFDLATPGALPAGQVACTPAFPPASPGPVTATPVQGGVLLEWRPGSGMVTDYTVEYSAPHALAPTLFTDPVSAQPSIVVAGLAGQVDYDFTLRALNPVGQSTPVQVTSPALKVDATIPPAPASKPPSPVSGVEAASTSGAVNLTWTPPPGPVGGFEVSYRLAPSGPWVAYPLTDPRQPSVSMVGLTNGTVYDFTVMAVNDAGTSAPSTPVRATPVGPPASPPSLQGYPYSQSAALVWQPVTSTSAAPVTGYRVYQLNASSGLYELVRQTADLSWVVDDLTDLDTHWFTVAAYGPGGQGPRSPAVSVTPSTPPAPPTNLIARPYANMVALAWDASSTPVSDYTVQYRITGRDTWQLVDEPTSTLTSLEVDGLDNRLSYDFRVGSVGPQGSAVGPQYSYHVSATPSPDPSVPVYATPGPGSVRLDWPAADGSGYRVFQLNPSTALFEQVGQTQDTTYTLTGLQDGVLAAFMVASFSPAGQATPSTVLWTQPYTHPTVPLSLSAQAGNSTVYLSWTPPAGDGGQLVSHYLVQYRPLGASSWVDAPSPDHVTSGASVLGLSNAQAYEVRLAALNAAGPGPFTPPAQFTPHAAPPLPSMVVIDAGSKSLGLTWDALPSSGAAPVSGYRVLRRISSTGGFEQVAQVGSPGWVDDAVSPDLTYWYQVQGYGPGGPGPLAGPYPAALDGPPAAPLAE